MSAIDKKVRRDVVPRWRLSSSSQSDLDSLPSTKVDHVDGGDQSGLADEILSEFVVSQKPMVAAEALSVAIAEGANATALRAAHYLSKFDLSSRPALHALVTKWANFEQKAADPKSSLPVAADAASPYQLVRRQKNLVRAYPSSPLGWLDLGFAYAAVGQLEGAKRAVEVATSLERNHRGVVRSSSRFFVHSGDFDKALWVISRSSLFKNDPWLMSAHIATSRAAGYSSVHMGTGRRMLKDHAWRDDQISELGAALATAELEHGNVKLAQKFAKRSLTHPTENAVAQVAWLEMVGNVDFDASAAASSIPAAWEARTFEEFEKGNWRRSCDEAALWLVDQPFSSRPAVQGSYVAATFLEDYELALRFAEAGFRANPTDTVIANNYAVCLAERGNPGEARAVFASYLKHLDPSLRPTLSATDGLILYREGVVDGARQAYEKARAYFSEMHDHQSQVLASIYQFREEWRLENYKSAADVINPLLDLLSKNDESRYGNLQPIVEGLQRLIESKPRSDRDAAHS